MESRSAKNKGKRLQHWVCEKISGMTGYGYGKDEYISSREMGQSGTDVRLIGRAKEMFPLAIECKNQETWSIPSWVEQAKKNVLDGFLSWALFIKRNRHEVLIVLDAEFFFEIWSHLIGRDDFFEMMEDWKDGE